MRRAPEAPMGRRSTGTAALLSPAVEPARISFVPPRGLRSRSEVELDAFLAAPVAAPTVVLKRPSRPPPRRPTPAAPQPSESTLTVDIGEVELIDPDAPKTAATRGKLGWKVGALVAVLGLCAFGYLRVERPDVLTAARSKVASMIDRPEAPVLSAAPTAPSVAAAQAAAAAPTMAPPAAPVPTVAAAPVVVAQSAVPEVTRGPGTHHPARAPHRAKPVHKAPPSVAVAAAAPPAPSPAPPAKPKGPVSADVHQSQRAAAQANQVIGNSL